MLSCTFDQRLALCVCPAEYFLLLLQEEMCLIRVQAAEVSPYGQVEPQLSGRLKKRVGKREQLPVGTLLAVWKSAYILKTKDFSIFK